jgi:hypothetical protein
LRPVTVDHRGTLYDYRMLSPEEFCDNVKLAFQQNLQAALDAQTAKWAAADAAAGRTIELTVPDDVDYYIGGVPDRDQVPDDRDRRPRPRLQRAQHPEHDGDAGHGC